MGHGRSLYLLVDQDALRGRWHGPAENSGAPAYLPEGSRPVRSERCHDCASELWRPGVCATAHRMTHRLCTPAVHPPAPSIPSRGHPVEYIILSLCLISAEAVSPLHIVRGRMPGTLHPPSASPFLFCV